MQEQQLKPIENERQHQAMTPVKQRRHSHSRHHLKPNHPKQLIGAIDQGTSSTRFLVFENGTGHLVASKQLEIRRIVPKEGWVEICPNAIMDSVYSTIDNVHEQLELLSQQQHGAAGVANLKCIGICNQRESAVVWDSKTGKALYNVIVWMDNRTKDLVDDMIDSVPGRDFNWLKDKTGLPMSTYFSAFKLKWLIDNVDEVKVALKEKRLMFGTVDSWILWNLTGKHQTDVTNASRTFLMDIETLNWDKSLCKLFNIPVDILPKILASADDFGQIQHGPLKGLPITGVIGDQSAALFGHNCIQLGQTKATFGTGCFIMQNIGPGPLCGAMSGVHREAKRGLITTVAFKLKDKPACYALEGSIKIAGAALTWLRDNIQLIKNYEEVDQLVNMTSHSAGVFFVPALGGLYSPYWDPNASGLYIGLSQFTRREHLVRATFDSIGFQTNDILSLMRGVRNCLMIDGGLCKSDNMCQILADITGCDIVRPSMCETSALGAAMVAGCGAGIWSYEDMLANSNTPYEYSCNSNQNNHYPHESLHYEEKFSSLIHSKNSTCSPALSVTTNHQQPVVEQDTLCCTKLDNGRGINDDAGGGINDDAGGGKSIGDENEEIDSQLENSDESSESGAATSCSLGGSSNEMAAEIVQCQNQKDAGNLFQLIDSTCQMMRLRNEYATPSSGYNSGDVFEVATCYSCAYPSMRRGDSPISSSQTTDSVAAEKQAAADCDQQTIYNNNNNKCSNSVQTESEVDKVIDTMTADDGDDAGKQPSDNGQVVVHRTSQTIFPSNLSACLRNYICPPTSGELNDQNLVDSEDNEDDELYEADCDSTTSNEQQQQPLAGRRQLATKPVDVFQSYISLEHRTELVNTWSMAVERSMKWTKVHHEEVRRIDYQRLSSLPISIYLFCSIGMVALSGLFAN